MDTPRRQAEPAPALRPLDVAYGIPLGSEAVPPLERAPVPPDPLAAVEQVLLEALRRPPCVVSFSGGRDSSSVLAAAARVARREGLDLPVPMTVVFPHMSETDETEWQSSVVRHLQLVDWERLELTDELDAVGPVATQSLRRHGLFWPFNAHFHVPIFERASGGTVVSGFGGDELGNSLVASRAERLLASRRLFTPRDYLAIGLAAAPGSVRTAIYRRRFRAELIELPWLTDEGLRQVSSARASDEGAMPLGWESKVRQGLWPSRYLSICRDNFRIMGAVDDVAVVHPFVDGRVLDALGQVGGFRGMSSRTELLESVFGELLPEKVINRGTKGHYTSPLWTPVAMEFARQWSGGGFDRSLIDPDALRTHWAGNDRNLLSTTLLQAAWLHDHPDVGT